MHIEPTTPINNRLVPYSVEILNTADLKFWEENPRVYAAIQGHPEFAGASPERRQEIIFGQMKKEESTARAREGLKRHGGLQEPLVVDYREMVVIEGNSRLAAARQLAEGDEAHWGALECRCYNDITEEEKIALLNQMHIQGKVQWTPYAKAATYHRQWEKRWEDEKWTKKYIAEVNGVHPSTVSREITIIEKMIAQDDNDQRKYSWYKVVFENKKLMKEFDRVPNLRQKIMETVKKARTSERDEKNSQAAHKFRDHLRAIVAKPKAMSDYAKGKLTLENAAEMARVSTAAQKLRKARELVQAIEKADISGMNEGERNDATLTLKRLGQDIECVRKWIDGGGE